MSKFDTLINAAAARHLPDTDWRIFKAQIWAESGFNPRAVSPVGAQGLGQIMPGTWAELGGGDPFDPETNLYAAAQYMARMIKTFTAPRTDDQRHDLAMASYNAGAGNIIKAQKLAGGNANWPEVVKVLGSVTGHHAQETIKYVAKIRAQFDFYCRAGGA